MLRHFTALFALAAVLLSARAVHANPPHPAVREADAAAYTADLAGQRLLRLLGETRLGGDRRSVACVDEKLSEVNSFARTIAARRERLRSAEERGDRIDARYERAVLRTLVAQLRRLERAGRACVDREAGTNRTIVVVERDPNRPREELALDR